MTFKHLGGAFVLLVISACVTINVYFPAAEVESAASEFIREVIGPDETAPENSDKDPNNPQSSLWNPLSFLISSAHAQVNINLSSPAINELSQRMKTRYESGLKDYLDGGVVGFNNTGFVEVVDASKLPLRERQSVNKLVSDDNRDREALYRELAVANGHPEWEEEIQNVFVKQWIEQAHRGWQYQSKDGAWKTK